MATSRILHWDLNVSDLERSIDFYEATTTFRAERTEGPPRSAILVNTNGATETPRLRLIEVHAEAAAPHRRVSAAGFTRIVFHVADLDKARRDVAGAGSSPFFPTTADDFRFVLGSAGLRPYHVFATYDPDGVIVEFIADTSPKLSTVAQGTRDLVVAGRFASQAFGFVMTDTVATPGTVANVYVPEGGTVEFSGAFYRSPALAPGYLDILQYAPAEVIDPPYTDADHLGVIRCAIETTDLDESELSVRHAGGDVEWRRRIDYGVTLGRRDTVGLRDSEGVRYSLVAG